jgi:hypothetical protein
MLIVDQIDQRIREPELCIRIASLRRDPRTADQRIIRPEDQRHRVEKEYPFVHIFHAAKLGISALWRVSRSTNFFSQLF